MNIKINYGFADSPFGRCSIAFIKKTVYALTFPKGDEDALLDFSKRLKTKDFERNDAAAKQLVSAIFDENFRPSLELSGTPFQLKVWEELQRIPAGAISTYSEIATRIGHPKAVRAVGTAIGANPVAYLIPCHRVLRTDGALGGFRWGLDIKKQMLAAEKL